MGAIYLEVIDLKKVHNDFGALYVQVGKPLTIAPNQILTPFVRAEGYWAVATADMSNGGFLFAGASHSWDVMAKVNILSDLIFGYDMGSFSNDSGTYLRGSIRVGYEFVPGTEVFVVVKSASPLSVNDGRETQFVPGLGISHTF